MDFGRNAPLNIKIIIIMENLQQYSQDVYDSSLGVIAKLMPFINLCAKMLLFTPVINKIVSNSHWSRTVTDVKEDKVPQAIRALKQIYAVL